MKFDFKVAFANADITTYDAGQVVGLEVRDLIEHIESTNNNGDLIIISPKAKHEVCFREGRFPRKELSDSVMASTIQAIECYNDWIGMHYKIRTHFQYGERV